MRGGEWQFPCWSQITAKQVKTFHFKITVSEGYYKNSWTYKLGHVATIPKPYSNSFEFAVPLIQGAQVKICSSLNILKDKLYS